MSKARRETRQEKLDREFDEHMAQEAVTTGHRVVFEFDGGWGVEPKLICPESGCKPATQCASCAANFGDPGASRCYDCADAKVEDYRCWLQSWFDDDPIELIHGKFEVPVEAIWDCDHPVIRIVALPPAQKLDTDNGLLDTLRERAHRLLNSLGATSADGVLAGDLVAALRRIEDLEDALTTVGPLVDAAERLDTRQRLSAGLTEGMVRSARAALPTDPNLTQTDAGITGKQGLTFIPHPDRMLPSVDEAVRHLGSRIRHRREMEDSMIAAEDWYTLPSAVLRTRGEALLKAARVEKEARDQLAAALQETRP